MTQIMATVTRCRRLPGQPPVPAACKRTRLKRRPAPAAVVTAIAIAVLAGSVLSVTLVSAALAGEDPRIAASRDYVARLQAELGARLQAAMAEGGPVGAIAVCQIEAPRIAQAIAAGAEPTRIGRTALKVRNPANAPDDHARAVMEGFRGALASGSEPPLTSFTARQDGSARYLQAIVTQPLCLGCHGTELAEDVREAIGARYPDDAAIGFAVGELRGAFIVEWPAPPPKGG